VITKKKKFGLIGHPLKHSFSPGYFSQKFMDEGIHDCQYDLYDLESIRDFEGLLDQNLIGLNVTIPYKEKVIPYLDELSDDARQIGAVNTIKFTSQGLVGYNTDTYGFSTSLEAFYGGNKPDSALVLGSGGASKAVCFSLGKLGIKSIIVSRKSQFLNYGDLDHKHLAESQLIVNTTPLGTWPDVDSAAEIPYKLITSEHFLYDLVYNPEKTLFLKQGEDRGDSIKNGHDMLKLQAEKSWEIWNS